MIDDLLGRTGKKLVSGDWGKFLVGARNESGCHDISFDPLEFRFGYFCEHIDVADDRIEIFLIPSNLVWRELQSGKSCNMCNLFLC